MRSTGDLRAARASYVSRSSRNLEFLLRERYQWMHEHIDPSADQGVELGCGIGAGREFIRTRSLLLTDLGEEAWVDLGNVDALATPFDDEQFDFVVAQNVVHHLPYPIRLFEEAARILTAGGMLLIRDVKCSLLMRAVIRMTKAEGYSYDVDVFDPDELMSDPDSSWEANNAVPDLLFDDLDDFHHQVHEFEVLDQTFDECLIFLNSGGVTHKAPSIPLPSSALRALGRVDRWIARRFPDAFALQRSLALRKR